MRIDGTLLTGDFAGVTSVGDLFATVRAEMQAATLGGTLYNFMATAELDDVAGLSTSANWASSFVSAGGPPSFATRESTVDYAATFNDAFFVNIGDTLSEEVILTTTGHAVGPFELWAIADFFNTASVGLSIDTPGVTLEAVVIPLPAGLPLLAAGIALIGIVRRKKLFA